MTDNIEIYKSISLNIIKVFEDNDLDKLAELLNKRQEVLDKEINNENFKKSLINDGILDIDKKIHDLLSKSMCKVKEEIKSHKKSNIANNSYINFNKQNLNIFNKKV